MAERKKYRKQTKPFATAVENQSLSTKSHKVKSRKSPRIANADSARARTDETEHILLPDSKRNTFIRGTRKSKILYRNLFENTGIKMPEREWMHRP